MSSLPDPEQAAARRDVNVAEFLRQHAWALTVWAAMLGWTIVLYAIVRSDYLNYRLARFDLGNMVQAVWSTAHGRPLDVTGADGDQMTRLGGHVDPILVLLTPLWVALPSPLTLAGAQVAACALGALPVFWLGRRHLASEKAATLIAWCYLAYPWLAWTALDAMHPVTLAIPLLLFAIWFLDTDRLASFAVCAVLVLATGEVMGITVAGLGLWYAVARGRPKAGLAIAAVGAGWSIFALRVVVPAFSGESSAFYGFYETVGGSPRGLVETAFTDPTAILSELFAGNVFLYVFVLGAPLAGMFLLAPGLAAVSLAQLSVNALADPLGPIDPRQHYLAAILPILFAASVFGVARLREERQIPVVITMLTLSIIFSALFGPWSVSPGRTPLWYQTDVSPEHIAVLDRAVELVPDGAPASATNKVGLRLSARRYLATAPTLGEAEWIVLDAQDPGLVHPKLPVIVRDPKGFAALTRRLESSPKWVKVFEEDGVYVFRREGS